MSTGRLGSAASLILAGLLLIACGVEPSPMPFPSIAVPTVASALPTSSSPVVSTAPSPSAATPTSPPTREAAADVLIQLQWGRTRPEAYVRFGRIPEFTLQTNGSVFYIDEGDPPQADHPQLMVAHLTPAEVEELVQQVQDLGLERLESYTDECWQTADGSLECAEGALYSILELNQMPEAWLQLCNVADFANDPETLKAIRTLLQDYRRSDAWPYVPEKAAVFIQPATALEVAPLEWPLDPSWLAPAGGAAGMEWVKVASGADLQALLSVAGRNMGDFAFHVAGADQAYQVYLVPWLPWLPNMDPTDRTIGYSRFIPATAVPGATQTPTPIAPCLQAKQGTSRLIIEEHPLKVGPMIPQVEGPYFETADGDTAEILAKNECYRAGEALWDFSQASVGGQPLELRDSGDSGDELQITLGGGLVYDVLTRPCALTMARGSWGYEGHWVVELQLPDEQDPWFPTKGQLLQDGQDLNAVCGYEESYNFALLGGRPFYFYQKEGGPGIFYDGQVLPLSYDEIPHYRCCSAGAMNPETFPNMVRFFGRRGEQWYYVEAYVPFDEAQKAILCPPTPRPEPTVTPVPTPLDNPVSPQAGAAQTRQADGMVMVYIPAGGFQMGSGWDAWDLGQQPQHTVYLDAFWIDETEVTNGQYLSCVEAGVCRVVADMSGYDPQGKPGHPVEVTWSDAQAYCLWAGARLPTEAEWEKAARGTDGRTYPWGNARPDCNLATAFGKDGACATGTVPVGSAPAGASPYGALDMAGNAAEWVNDWFDYEYYAQSPERNPPGPGSGTSRVVRGGDWNAIPDWISCFHRDGWEPDVNYFGFRCATPAGAGG